MCNICVSMYGYQRDCQAPVNVNGYLSQTVPNNLPSDCVSVTSHNSGVVPTSRAGLMAISSGNEASPNGHSIQHHHGHHGHHGGHHHHHNSHQNRLQHTNHHTSNNTMGQGIFDVWGHNFVEGMRMLRYLAKLSSVIAVDTEFPGVVAKVYGEYANSFEQSYHSIKVNIDLLKPIQIGFSFFNDSGVRPEPISTVQFNMKWDVEVETYAEDSISLLQNSGIDFDKLKRQGVDLDMFGEAFITCGLALNDSMTWIGFHSAYDWAYMLKVCTSWDEMPEKWTDFHKILQMFFPRIVDIKTLMNESKVPKCGLQELADQLKVSRVGAQHQAGSDAKLTGEAYFRFLQEYCTGEVDPKQVNYVYGLNYCPNGAHNIWTPMNAPSPTPDGTNGLDSGPNGSVHGSSSPENSGRNSPMEVCGSASSTGTSSS